MGGEYHLGVSANFQSVKIMSSVKLPVAPSLPEIKAGQHLAVIMARDKALKAMQVIEADLKELKALRIKLESSGRNFRGR